MTEIWGQHSGNVCQSNMKTELKDIRSENYTAERITRLALPIPLHDVHCLLQTSLALL